MVITLTNLPADIEEFLQRKAEVEGKSVDQAAIDLLERGVESERAPKKRIDLSDIAGQRLIDDEMRKVFEEQRQIDPELWK